MPDYKPVVFHDFAAGHMPEALTEQAFQALRDYGYSNAIQELRIKLGLYLENKSLIDADPKHLYPIYSEYVEIWPLNYFHMEAVLGKEVARANAPRAELIPSLCWTVQDYLELTDEELATAYKAELNTWITGLIGNKSDFFDIATKWLFRSGTKASEALSFMARRKSNKDQKNEANVA